MTLAINPVQQLFSQALLQHQNGHLEAAQAGYEAVLQHNPKHVDANHLLGMLLSSKQDYVRALSYLEQAIALHPKEYSFWGNRALALEGLQNYDEALASFDRALSCKQDCPITWYNRGNILKKLGKLEEALHSFERAVAVDNNFLPSLLNASIVLQGLCKFDEALEVLNRALRINPSAAEIYLNRGNIFKELKQYTTALQNYEQAIALQANYAGAHMNRGLTFQAMNQFERAFECYDTALSFDPNDAEIHYNRAVIYHSLQQFDHALTCYDQAIAVNPQHANSYWNKASLHLIQGQYELGWLFYEWRWKIEKGPYKRSFSQPRWVGDQPLDGKTILLYNEQGMGDTLQFCRYVPQVKALGATVILAVDELLEDLVKNSPLGMDMLLTGGSPIPQFDFHCPILSLPLALRCFTEQAIPRNIPYLFTPRDKILAWCNKLGPRTKPRIGLVWNGGQHLEQQKAISARRDISFGLIARLNRPDIDFYSLQKGEPAESELITTHAQHWQGDNFHVLTQDIHHFSDTAALIYHLDLVIAVDTSTAHLAGAMGKPVWLLNRFDSCWRWLLGRDDSPWYPTMHIFQQQQPDDWESVLLRVSEALDHWRRNYDARH